MRHAGPATLERIETLLEALRSREALREPRPGVFTLRSRAFLHFHDDEAGVFADVKLGDEFVRMRVSDAGEQADLLDRIDECLSREEGRRRAKGRALKRRGAAG